MKNKALTYLLILSVAAVWGIIFYRIFSAADSTQPEYRPVISAGVRDESLDKFRFKDTFKLALNYRDPFLGKVLEDVNTEPSLAELNVEPVESDKPLKPPVNWTGIKYTGVIINPSGKRMVAILTINGKEHMLSAGQSADGLKLLKASKDFVQVTYQGESKNLSIQ